MLALTILSLSLGSVSAEQINDTDSFSMDDNSQLNENVNEDNFLNTDENDVLNAGITPDVKITDNINNAESKNVTKGTTVNINVQATADFSYHYDYKVATLYVNGNSVGSTNLLQYNGNDNDRRGSFDYTFTNDGTYSLKVVLAAYPGYSISYNEATSNIITYIVGNASSESGNTDVNVSNGTAPEVPDNASVKVTVWDRMYPNNSTIYSDGDYVCDVEYAIVKSGDGFSDENLEVYVNGQSIGRTTPNASNRLGNLNFDEDNEWNFYIEYSASVNGQNIAVTSNTLTIITRNTSGGPSNASGNTTDNSTEDVNGTDSGNSTNNPEPAGNDIKILIRDANYPNNSTITLNGKYNVLLEYYVTVPSGDLLRNEIILMCNNEAIASISDPNDKSYTSFGGSVLINETGNYVFSANYYYYEFMGACLNGEVNSNVVTYKLTVSNESGENNPIPSENSTNGTAPSGEGNNSVPSTNVTNGTVPSGVDDNSTSVNVTNGTVPSGEDINNETPANNTNGETPSIDGNNSSGNNSNIKFSIDSSDMLRAYNSPFDYKATFYDKNGNPLKDTEVLFVINGNDYNVVTDEYGVAKIVKSLYVGNFEVNIFNPATSDTVTRNITIVDRIVGYKKLTMDYSYSAKYKIRLFADNGNPVGAGESVTIKISNVKYTAFTDSKGYATVTIKNSKLVPKTYTVTATYKDVKASSKLVVKAILKSKNVSFKKSAKTKKFTATLKTSAGKAIKGKKITFKIKGKTYKAKTNSKGVATIKVTNLKKVGKYTVTVKYLKSTVKKTIKIKK